MESNCSSVSPDAPPFDDPLPPPPETPLPATGEGGAGELIRSQPLPIHDLELTRVSAKDDEVRANITFMVVRVHDLDTGEEGE